MTKKRNAAYYEGRLRREFPKIFADLRAGRITSVRQAAAQAGLIHLPTRFVALKREWKGATSGEQHAFIAWIRKSRAGLKVGSKLRPPIADTNRRLRSDVVIAINRWLERHNLKAAAIMKEMKISPLNVTLSQALGSGRGALQPDVIEKLEHWIAIKAL